MRIDISDSEIALAYTETTVIWVRPNGAEEGLNCVVNHVPDEEVRRRTLPKGEIQSAELDGGYLHIVINQTGLETNYQPRYVYIVMDRKASNVLYYQAYKEVVTMSKVDTAPEGFTVRAINPGLSTMYGVPNPK